MMTSQEAVVLRIQELCQQKGLCELPVRSITQPANN